MQTIHTTTHNDLYGSFKHTRTISVRRRPGMSGAYVRLKITPVLFAPVARYDSGWKYHNNYSALQRWCKEHKKEFFATLLTE
jgi:hypothetical protein